MPIETLIRAYTELLYEAYYDRDDGDLLPLVGKKRSMAGLRIRNPEAHRWVHIFDDRIHRMAAEMEKRLVELGREE